MNVLSLTSPELDLSRAVTAANQWTVTARPIVKAIFALEDAEFELRAGLDQRTWEECRPLMSKPQRELREMLDGLRDNFLCDQMPPQPGQDATDDECQARDDFHDEVCRQVTSVDALIRMIGDEM